MDEELQDLSAYKNFDVEAKLTKIFNNEINKEITKGIVFQFFYLDFLFKHL